MATKDTGSKVQPYLFFDGRCEEALEFYRTALKAEVQGMMRFKDNPDLGKGGEGCGSGEGCGPMPADLNKVMHASFRVGNAVIMASDGCGNGQPKFEGVSLCISAADEAEADSLFAALAEGGQVQMPLTTTFFSPRFGMVADRFGVSWMIIVAPQQ